MKQLWLPLAWILLSMHGMLAGMTVDDVIKNTGLAGGLCSFPRAGTVDEPLALELAKRPAFIVHILAEDSKLVTSIRARAEAEGLLGRSFYVEQGKATPLPFADRLVDLLIVSDLCDADLTPELRNAWIRALAPRRGVALVGCGKETTGKLSQEALKAWIKDLPLANVTADDSGVWALLRTELPAGSDEWTHRCHGSDNTQVSKDSTLKPPFLAQWWGMPRQEGFWGTTVVADHGRMFSIRSNRTSNTQVFLTARSLTNGIVLWHRLLQQAPHADKIPHDGYIPGRSCMAVSGNSLFLVDKDGVLHLNAETGAEQGRIAGPKPGGQIKWIACSEGLLSILAGDSDVMTILSFQTVAGNPTGRELAVYDTVAKKELWHETLAGDTDERLIAVRDNQLYSMVQGVGMACREVLSGKLVWTNPDADIQTEFRVPESKTMGGLLSSQPTLVAYDDVLLLRTKWAKNTVALSRTDGSILWKNAISIVGTSGRGVIACEVNGLWVGAKGSIDLKTGKTVKGPKFIGSGCGVTTSIPGYLISCFGSVLDIKSGKVLRDADIKSPCDIGTIVAEGMLVTIPSQCGCNFEVKGYRVLTSAGAIQPHTAPDWKERLTVLDTAEPEPLAMTEADWPTYRRDAQRSASSQVSVGSGKPRILWQWKPAGAAPFQSQLPADASPRLTADFMTTAPVAVADYVFFGSHDGTVHCVMAADGKEVWSFPTGGMLFAPPTIWKGRVLVGGGDGQIYCLNATTGRCLWKLRAAPVDRRVFWFGHLVSTWPVIPGVVVQDDIAYAVAGYQKDSGIHAYAIEPKTGQVLWEKDDAGTGGPSGPGGAYSCSGGITVGSGKLWLCSSSARPGSFDLKTGDWELLKYEKSKTFGSDIGVLNGKWVIQGGRRFSDTQDTLHKPLGIGFFAWSMETPSTSIPIGGITCLPAWDTEIFVIHGRVGGLTAVPTARLLEWFQEMNAQAKLPKDSPQKNSSDWSDLKLWTTENLYPVAFALAKDQMVMAYSERKGFKVSGFNRTDGTKAWSVDLPEQPVMNRLALDRNGRVLVALCDGSIICLAVRPD